MKTLQASMPRLDQIPRDGAVSKRSFNDFAANYREPRGCPHPGSLPSVFRVDAQEKIGPLHRYRAGIAKALGITAAALQTFERYWDLVQRIWRCPWNRAPRPRRPLDRRPCDARVALLDSLYYDAGA